MESEMATGTGIHQEPIRVEGTPIGEKRTRNEKGNPTKKKPLRF